VLRLVVYLLLFGALLFVCLSAIVTILAGLGGIPVGLVRRLHPWATWIGGPAARTSILSRLAIAAAKSGQPDKATELARRALRASARGTRATRAQALTTLGVVHRSMGQLARAQESFRRAMDLAAAGSSRANQCRTAINLGQISTERGEFESAREALETAAALGPSGGDLTLLLLASGYLHYLSLDYRNARQEFARGLEVARAH
jgi:tetratricopeptide (TPR) repeat protein